MRETKDQKIIRLERQKAELGDLVKELKKKVRDTGKDSKEEITNLKRKIRDLRTKHKLEIEKLTSERDSLLLEVEKLKKDLELSRYLRKQAEPKVKSLSRADSWLEEDPKESQSLKATYSDRPATYKEIQAMEEWDKMCKDQDERNLEAFNFGLDKNHDGLPFFDPKDLLITINPKTGRRLTPFQREMLLNSLRNNEEYKRFLRSAEEITYESIKFEHCRNLYNMLYKDFDFDSL